MSVSQSCPGHRVDIDSARIHAMILEVAIYTRIILRMRVCSVYYTEVVLRDSGMRDSCE